MDLCQVGYCPCVTFEKLNCALAVLREAIGVAIEQARSDFSQVVFSNRLIAHRTEGSLTTRPAIDQYESHGASPNAKRLPRDARCDRRQMAA